jgi:hypothetical protein
MDLEFKFSTLEHEFKVAREILLDENFEANESAN